MATADHEPLIPPNDATNLATETTTTTITPTDFGAFVTRALARRRSEAPAEASSASTFASSSSSSSSSSTTDKIDQNVIRQCINLASSFLITDVATNPAEGMSTWSTGLNRLVDIVIVLHVRKELEVDTVSAASRACSECWTIAGSWRGLEGCRQRVREVGGRLHNILDPNEKTYRGQRVYAP